MPGFLVLARARPPSEASLGSIKHHRKLGRPQACGTACLTDLDLAAGRVSVPGSL